MGSEMCIRDRINGRRVPLAGRVSMDMITVDLTDLPEAEVGDSVILWGRDLPAEEIARHVNTITYELFCKVTPRVAVVETEGDEAAGSGRQRE